MSRKSLFQRLAFVVALAVMAGGQCVPQDEGTQVLPNDEPSGQTVPVDGASLHLMGVQSLSWHYLELVFDAPLTSAFADPSLYEVTGPNGETLPVYSTELREDPTRILLVTAPQQEVQYQLVLKFGPDMFAAAANRTITFKGTTTAEPFLASAIALSPTSVLATYGGAMDSNIGTPSYYEIAGPDLDVLAATPGTTMTSALLTTSQQENIDYTLRVTNVTSGEGTRLLDPERSRAIFNGIAPNEPPLVTGATATSATTVLVSFNKPMADAAADPTKFSVSPGLVVTTAEASLYNTQIKLTTLPMVAGQSYVLTVADVKDRGGNLIQPGPGSQATFTFLGQPQTDGSGMALVLPRVVGAASLSNTSVMVVFNKPMGDSALATSAYVIVQENVNAEVGTLLIAGTPTFLGANRTTVVLTTSSQNEVTYRVKAVNVRDLAGNELAPQELLVDPTSATFAGTPPTGSQIVDTDLDGVPDNLELKGYVVTTVGVDGEVTREQVTSDPNVPDTDGDGLTDGNERNIRTNPRSYDSDGDLISDNQEFNVWFSSPLHQDTDGDSLDDNLEIFFFKTSALFTDSDGDGLKDDDEVIAGNRDPRLSDLPQPAIAIGEVALRLDTRFQYTNKEGVQESTQQQTEAKLTQSDERTFTTSDTETNKFVAGTGLEMGGESGTSGSKKTIKGNLKFEFTHENTFTASQSSKASTQNEYQKSLTVGVQRDISKEVQRTVAGASIDLSVNLGNFGDIPFTLKNMEITALLQDPYNRRSFLPVGSLLPASAQGGNFEVFLGPFIQERGPFVFHSTEVFPSLVEDLMKNPRGLIFKVANYDVTDEQGRNFAFISQDVNDRTAGIIIDYGNGQVDRHRVATTSQFDAAGRPSGITMAYALQDILGLQKNGPQDAITVGFNGCAETFAVGDDVQVVVPICFPVTPGGVIIEPGPNGILETLPGGDDVKSPDGLRIIDGGDGCAHTRAQRDDVQIVLGDCVTGGLDGVVILAGPNGVIDTTPLGDDQLGGVSGYGTEMIGACDGATLDTQQIIEPPFDGNGIANSTVRAGTDDVQLVALGSPVTPGEVIIAPGANGILESRPIGDEIRLGPGALCNTGSDCPGGGACRQIEQLVRVKGVTNVPEEARFWVVIAPSQADVGSNFDALRLQAGQTYSLAFVQDQDMDGLYDREEFLYGSSDRDDNSDGCPLGDGAPGCSTSLYDFDTVRDYEEVKTGWRVQVAGQSSYPAFCDPVQPDTDADRLFDDEERAIGSDPGKRDSDDDGISDYEEVRGYQIVRRDGALIRNVVPYQSAIILPGQNGLLDTARVGDDLLGQNTAGQQIITPGPDGLLQSVPDQDDRQEGTAVILDGGNGIPETAASPNDVQVGPSPVASRTVTVTFVDYQPNGSSCDGLDEGEFYFDLRVRKGVDSIIGQKQQRARIDRFDTHFFGGIIVDNGNLTCNTTAAGDDVQIVAQGAAVAAGGIVIGPGPNGKLDTTPAGDDVAVAPSASYDVNAGLGDTISISASLLEDDPVCSAATRSVIIEPAQGGNGKVDTVKVGDDEQLKAIGLVADPGETIIRSCPSSSNGVLDSLPGEPGLCEEVITAGSNATADTTVGTGTDDVQVQPPGTTGLTAGTAVISPGPNGTIDTVPSGDDNFVAAVVPWACPAVIVEPDSGGNGTADTLAQGDDVQVIAVGQPVAAGGVVVSAGPNGLIDSTLAGDDVLVPPTLKSNGDCSTCLAPAATCVLACSACSSGACFGDDTVRARASGDSCEDAWLTPDPNACPCGSCNDFNSSSPSTFASWAPQSVTFTTNDLAAIPDEGLIVTFENGPGCFSSGKLRVLVRVSTGSFVTPGAVLVRAGLDETLSTTPFGDDVVGVAHVTAYATNPLDRDTDADTLFDGAEMTLGANPNDALDAQRFRDNDLDGLPNGVELDGWVLGYVDSLGTLRCLTSSGNMEVSDEFNPPSECIIVHSDPFEPDSDFDGLPDLLEQMARSDPSSPDTDLDGLLDYDEFDPNSKFSISMLTLRAFQRECQEASRCGFTPASEPYGTSIVLADTDSDGSTDRAEVEDFWTTSSCTQDALGNIINGLPKKVFSSPLDADFDLDGLLDGEERAQFLDPGDSDSDDDGITDKVDQQPDGCGKLVTVTFKSYAVQDDCEGAGDGEFRFRLYVTQPNGTVVPFSQNADNLDDNESHTYPNNFTTTFAIRPGQTFTISGHVWEADDSSGDEDWNFSRTYTYDSATTGDKTIGAQAGEADDGCFDDHVMTVTFTIGRL